MSEPTSPLPSRTRLVLADGGRTVLTRTHWRWLLAITVLAAVLRFVGIGRWSVWIDEAHTWRDATMPLTGKGGLLEEDRQFYALPFLVLRGLFALGLDGSDPALLRLPFVLVGIATVPILGIAGRRLVGASASVFAAGLLAVHPWHVFWSQNARGYVVVVLMAVVVANRLFAYARDDRMRDVLLMWAAIVLATLVHSTGLLLAVGAVAFFWLRGAALERRNRLRTGIVLVAVLAATPWLVKHYAPFEGFLADNASPSVPHLLQTCGFYFRPLALLAAAVGLWQLREFGGGQRARLFACLSIAPLVMLLDIGATVAQTTARYAICVLPFVTWLVAVAAWQTATAVVRSGAFVGVARALAIAAVPAVLAGDSIVALGDYYTNQHGQRARWAEAVAFLRQQAGDRPLRVATINHPTMLYYLQPGHWSFTVPKAQAAHRVIPILDWMIRDGTDFYTKEVVHPTGPDAHVAWHRERARADGALLAFVFTLPELVEEDPGGLRDAIGRECRLALHLPCWVGPKDESLDVYLLKEP